MIKRKKSVEKEKEWKNGDRERECMCVRKLLTQKPNHDREKLRWKAEKSDEKRGKHDKENKYPNQMIKNERKMEKIKTQVKGKNGAWPGKDIMCV